MQMNWNMKSRAIIKEIVMYGAFLKIVLQILSGAAKYKTGYCSLWVLLKNISDTHHALVDPLHYMIKQQG